MAQNTADSRHKYAEDTMAISQGGGDTQFEQSFSNIAHAYLRNTAPTLLDHEVGFQLLDKDEEGSRAIGVFAFTVGSQVLYAPVFFLNGELKGNELLYIKNQDMFVPLTEAWLQYIMARKPIDIGSSVEKQYVNSNLSNPRLLELSHSPNQLKLGSHVKKWAHAFMPAYAELQTADLGKLAAELKSLIGQDGKISVDSCLKVASAEGLQAICDWMDNDVHIAEQFQKWHGMEKLAAAVQGAESRRYKRSAMELPDLPQQKSDDLYGNVDVYLNIDMLPDDIKDPELEYFYSHSILVRDGRALDEKAQLLDENTDLVLDSPAQTGVYQVLGRSGEFDKKVLLANPVSSKGIARNTYVVLDTDGSPRKRTAYKKDQLFVNQSQADSRLAFNDWFDKLTSVKLTGSDAEEWSSSKPAYMGITKDGRATSQFTVSKTDGVRPDGSKVYVVSFSGSDYHDSDTECPRDDWAARNRFREPCCDCRLYVEDSDRGRIRGDGRDCYVPSETKFIRVERYSDDAFEPGSIRDAQARLTRNAIKVQMSKEGSRYTLDDKPQASKLAMVRNLIKVFSLSQADAEAVTSKLDGPAPRQKHAFYLDLPKVKQTKRADASLTYPDSHSFGVDLSADERAPNIMNFDGAMAPNTNRSQPIGELQASRSDLSGYNILEEGRNKLRTFVSQAAEKGDKDVFDIGMMAGMLKTVKEDMLIDKHIPDLLKAVDKLGRLLFVLYWHYDKFAARFGKNDMPELEDALRNSFEIMSDVVLFLKNKTIEPYSEDSEAGVSLSDSQF
jgi:hypothetical protein